ncbi:ATP-grasp domain-containing protein [Streptomyces sp. IMTB 2501]|uniref:ATP-grasp domain-containing protein n=1 Tax=Streptomyces sp. IMTB 2501 TaxID=1776340 RepID=UPI00096CB44A|nr:ATP-grasp domain-containing protein [Streptomyces sp. IMTB 2501]OLZ66939.1 ATP-grasp domain-containing protein [Streptomyces sp. IMTB 2501]
MRILVMHSLADSSVRYGENIDHHKHDVTYVSTLAKLGTLPNNVPARVIERPGAGDTAEEVLAAVKGLPKPDLIITLSEFDVIAAAQVRETLGVPGATVRQVLPVRNKVVMKSAVARAGLRVPRFAPLPQVLVQGAESVPWKGRTVLKPLSGVLAQQIQIFPTAAMALDAVRRGEVPVPVEDFEIEEFISGRIMHIDGVLAGGRPISILASRYVGTCLAYAEGSPLGSVQIDTGPELVEWSLSCLKAVGIENGLFHLEAIAAPEGPVFLEVGARCGGGGVIDSFELATGIRMPGVAVRVLVEGPVDLPEARIPGPDERYGWFLIPGHTLGSRYCRISGEQPFRDDPLVHRWSQRGLDEPVKFSYASSNVPIAAMLGPSSTATLERYMDSLFTSVRVQPHDGSA